LSPPCRPPRSALFPYTTLFRSRVELLGQRFEVPAQAPDSVAGLIGDAEVDAQEQTLRVLVIELLELLDVTAVGEQCAGHRVEDEIGRAHVELQSRFDLVCRLLL